MRLEKDLMKQISTHLGIYKLTGECVWYHRIQSGQAKVGSYYIKLAEAGTPDWFALMRMRDDTLGALFLEAKSSTGKLRASQQLFINKFMGKKDVNLLVIRSIDELDKWVEKYAKNFVNLLPKDL